MARRSPTSFDVAHRAGVSRATVSIVLNHKPGTRVSEATRRRVLEAAAELDYHVNAAARSLRRQRAGTIGLVVRQSYGRLSADAFLGPVIEGITSITGPAGARLLIEPLDPSRPVRYLSLVREGHVDGLIFSGARADDDALLALHADGVPVVLWGRLPGSDLPFVDVDNRTAAQSAVEHLIGLGHRRIACITNAHPTEAVREAVGRLEGYRAALDAHALPVDDAFIRYGNYDERSGFDAMQSLLANRIRPTAAFVASDEVALGALHAARAAGLRVPDDLSLAGFDDLPISRLVFPALTTVHVPAREIGLNAATMLMSFVESGEAPESLLLPTELVIRDSASPPHGRPAVTPAG